MVNRGNTLSRILSFNGLLFLALCLMLLFQLTPGGFSIYSSWIFSLWLLFSANVSKKIDKTAIAILVFGILYGIIPIIKGGSDIPGLFYFAVSPLFFYFYGRHLGRVCYKETDFFDFFLCLIICFSSFVYAQSIHNLFSGGSILYDERLLTVNNVDVAATVIGLYVCLGFVGLPFFLFRVTSSVRRIVYLLVFILSLVTVLSLVNRAGILVELILLLFSTLYVSRGKTGKIIVSLLLFAVLIVILYQMGLFNTDVIDAYYERTDNLMTGGTRFDRWKEAIRLLFIAPFGWESSSYAHNMWLDVAKVAGLAPFLALTLGTIRSIRLTLRIVKKAPNNIALFFLCFQTCFFVSCFDEPVIQAVPNLAFLYFIFWGLQEGYCKINSI